jgi:hypothetical protein
MGLPESKGNVVFVFVAVAVREWTACAPVGHKSKEHHAKFRQRIKTENLGLLLNRNVIGQ